MPGRATLDSRKTRQIRTARASQSASSSPPSRGIARRTNMDMQNRKKEVFTITEKKQSDGNSKSYFVRCGVAFLNGDGSTTIKLDCLPVSGVLQVRDERADRFARNNEPTTPPASTNRPQGDIFGGS
jgi:hypothetical protein